MFKRHNKIFRNAQDEEISVELFYSFLSVPQYVLQRQSCDTQDFLFFIRIVTIIF